MATSRYPHSLAHPNGFRTVTVYSPEEEKAVLAQFADFRRENNEAHEKAKAGEPISRRTRSNV